MERSGKPEPRAAAVSAPRGSGRRVLTLKHQLHPRFPQSAQPARPGRASERAPRAYLVESGHGCRAHHQGYADDGVAVEAIRVGHHHDPSDGEDGSHDLHGRKTRRSEQRRGVGGPPRADRGGNVCEGAAEGGGAPFQPSGDHAKAALLSGGLLLLARGHSAKPGVTQGPGAVDGKEQSRGSASCRGRAGHVTPGAPDRVVTAAATGSSVMTKACSSQLSGGALRVLLLFHTSTQNDHDHGSWPSFTPQRQNLLERHVSLAHQGYMQCLNPGPAVPLLSYWRAHHSSPGSHPCPRPQPCSPRLLSRNKGSRDLHTFLLCKIKSSECTGEKLTWDNIS